MLVQISQEAVKRVAAMDDESNSYTFTHAVPYECYLTETGTPCGSEFSANLASDFSLILVPEHAGIYTVSSPFTVRSKLYITVLDHDSEQLEAMPDQFLSTEHSYAQLETDQGETDQLEAGSNIVLKITPVSYLGTPITLSEDCTVSDSFYTINQDEYGEKRFSFVSE